MQEQQQTFDGRNGAIRLRRNCTASDAHPNINAAPIIFDLQLMLRQWTIPRRRHTIRHYRARVWASLSYGAARLRLRPPWAIARARDIGDQHIRSVPVESRPPQLLAFIVGLLCHASLGAQQPLRVREGGIWSDPLWEAASALQGNRLRGAERSAVLDSALIVEVAGALREIRQQVPGLSGRVMDESPASLIIGPSSALGARSRSIGIARGWDGWELPLRDGVPITGDSVFDSLSRRLNVHAATGGGSCGDTPNSFCQLYVRFSNYVNAPVVAAAYKRVPEVRFAHRDDALVTFVRARIEDADETGQAWRVSLFEGQGDCPAGCSGWIRSVVHYDRISRRAELRVRDATWPP